MKRRSALLAPAALAVAALALTACAGEQSTTTTDTIRTTIDIPATFDPTLTASLPDYLLARTSYDTLVRKDSGGLVAGLATEWTTTPTQGIFTIREDATCSDGTPITPAVVKDSLDYFARPGTASPVPFQVFGPAGSPTITADDAAGTVTIDLAAPWPFLATGLSISTTGIICPAGLADPDGLAAGTVTGSESGPYVLDSFEPGVRYAYTLRDDYDAWPEWTTQIQGVPAKNLEYVVSPDSTATANLVVSDQLDIAKVQAQTIDRFEGMEGYEVSVNRFSDFYLIFNEREGSIFADEALRQATVRAIDREMFEEVTSLGTGEIATTFVSSQTQCAPTSNPAIPAYDPAAAAVLDGVTIRLIGPTIAGPNGAGNEYLAEALRAAGAEVELTNTDVGTWVSTVFTEPNAWDVTMFADLNFLGSLISPLGSFSGPTILDGGGNVGGAANPEADAAIGEALVAQDDASQCAALNAAADALFERADALPLINDAFIYVQRPGFTVQMLGGALDDPIFRIAE